MDRKELREKLAALEHEQWMKWSVALENQAKLPPEVIHRWAYYQRPYEDLDEASKDIDRAWADKVLELIDEWLE